MSCKYNATHSILKAASISVCSIQQLENPNTVAYKQTFCISCICLSTIATKEANLFLHNNPVKHNGAFSVHNDILKLTHRLKVNSSETQLMWKPPDWSAVGRLWLWKFVLWRADSACCLKAMLFCTLWLSKHYKAYSRLY